MHFVDRSAVKIPPLIKQLKKIETPKWIAYYKKERASKPRSRWRDTAILEQLVTVFQQNCGYCGYATDIKVVEGSNAVRHAGQVDHYIPVSADPEKVYVWDNYIWSCKDCNDSMGKHDYFDPDCMIFNPCCRRDTDYLVFDGDRGIYSLKVEFQEDNFIRRRFQITEDKTWLNTDLRSRMRKVLFEKIKILLDEKRRKLLILQAGHIDEEIIQNRLHQINHEINNIRKITKHFKLLLKYLLQSS